MKSWPLSTRFFAILIWVFVTASQVERGVCFALYSAVPEASDLVQYVVLFCLTGFWLDRDSQEKRLLRVWDVGFFLAIAWPLIIPYYLIKTRGIKRASLILLLLAITYFGVFGIVTVLCRAIA